MSSARTSSFGRGESLRTISRARTPGEVKWKPPWVILGRTIEGFPQHSGRACAGCRRGPVSARGTRRGSRRPLGASRRGWTRLWRCQAAYPGSRERPTKLERIKRRERASPPPRAGVDLSRREGAGGRWVVGCTPPVSQALHRRDPGAPRSPFPPVRLMQRDPPPVMGENYKGCNKVACPRIEAASEVKS